MSSILIKKIASGELLAILEPASDAVREVYIDNQVNGPCTLAFELPRLSDKWKYIDTDNKLVVDGREFVLIQPGDETIEHGRTEEGQIVDVVNAHESWILLGKDFVSVSSDGTEPDWGIVSILREDPGHGGHDPGTAGAALSRLLAESGSGWSLGTVDVIGVNDLETDKLSLLGNIQKVQEIWGGLLIWDSAARTVSLRDSDAWVPYDGFQIRYSKNQKDITRRDEHDIVTRLYPFGPGGMDITEAEPSGKNYIEDYSYTNQVLKGVWETQDCDTPDDLLAAAWKQLSRLSSPRYRYSVKTLDLRVLAGYSHEAAIVIGHMADILDEDAEINVRDRIVRHKYNVLQPWDCELELGELPETLQKMLANIKKQMDEGIDVEFDDTLGALAYGGTINYRMPGAPSNNPVPSGIELMMTASGALDIKLTWGAYVQGEKKADFILLFWKKGASSGLGTPTINDSCLAFYVNNNASSYHVLEGVASEKYYSFGIAAARRTEAGLEIGDIISPSSAPNWRNVTHGTPNYTGNIDGAAASTVATAAQNFDSRNDRMSTTPANPTVLTDGTAVDHTLNTDGSANISFEWGFNGSGDAYNIDGFIIYLYQGAGSGVYTFGADPASEQTYFVPYDKRALIVYGVPANKYYTFGAQAYRIVDQDIDVSGIKKSSIIKSTRIEENPYRPSATIAFTGDITGTINGVSASEVSGAIQNFNDRNDRISTTPANPVVPTGGDAVDHTLNADGSANISFEWTFNGTGDAYNIDGFLVSVFASTFSGQYEFGDSDEEQIIQVPAERHAAFLYGVPANLYYTFGVQAYRIVDQDIALGGVLKSHIIKSYYAGENPYRPTANVAYTGDIWDTAHPSSTVISALDGFGNGEDGDFDSDDHVDANGLVTFNISTEDMHPVVKQYKSFNLKSGHTIRLNKRNQGLFIFCQGLFVCEGAIDQDGLGAKISKDKLSQSVVQVPVGVPCVRVPEGGKGGKGGNGGAGSGNKDDNRGFGGSGSGPSDPTFCGGAFGGAGGGGGAGRGSNADRSGLDGGDAGTSLLDEAVGPGGTGSQGDPGGTGGNLAGGGGGSGGGPYSAPPGGGGGGVNGGKQGVWQYTAHGTAADGDSGGGSPGGLIVICAKQIMITGLITANGADGADGGHGSGGITDYGNGGGGGGQGGGGGGVVVTVSEFLLTFGTITVNGGLGGQGGVKGTGGTINTYAASDGLPGQAGAVGTIINVQV